MIDSINKLYNEKITVINRIRGPDLGQREDILVASSVDSVLYRFKSNYISNNGNVSKQQELIVLFSDISLYKPYKEFVSYKGSSDFFTLSLGDYIVLGDIFDEVNSSNIRDILSKYEPYVYKIQSINKAKNRGFSVAKIEVECL